MLAGGLLMSGAHEPVMLAEIVELFTTVPNGVVLDATLGMAGHATAILRRHPGLHVVGIDRDDMAIANAAAVKASLGADAARFSFHRARFDQAASVLRAAGIERLAMVMWSINDIRLFTEKK